MLGTISIVLYTYYIESERRVMEEWKKTWTLYDFMLVSTECDSYNAILSVDTIK